MSGVATRYDLQIDGVIKFGVPAMLLLMFLFGVGMAVEAIRQERSAALFFVAWFGALAFVAWQVLATPLFIDDDRQGSLTFRSIARARHVLVSEIRSIEPVRGQFGFFRLVHARGRIVFLAQFTGFHRLLTEMLKVNPGIILKGC